LEILTSSTSIFFPRPDRRKKTTEDTEIGEEWRDIFFIRLTALRNPVFSVQYYRKYQRKWIVVTVTMSAPSELTRIISARSADAVETAAYYETLEHALNNKEGEIVKDGRVFKPVYKQAA
jgi:hypothetical protein